MLGDATRAHVVANSGRYLVRSSLRPRLDGDALRVDVIDVVTGARVRATKALDPIFKAAIDRVTTEAR